MKDNVIEKGKELAFLLRHDAEARENGIIDKNGWRSVSDLVKHHGYTRALLNEIVETNNKKRYEYDSLRLRIRARQGHSIDVEVELTPVTDVSVLYHGTSDRFLDDIMKEGLCKMSRNHVHLSPDIETAKIVGERHGGHTVVLEIDAGQMVRDGLTIYLSNNDVFLTEHVEPKYFKRIVV